MEFNHFLSSYYPDTSYGADRHYADMLEQAVTAERLGYVSVSIPEHHLMNILMNPAPLQMAIKVAGETRRIKIITSVVQLPLHDMRTYAGEVVLAELFTDGRLILGVGRGAFAVEMDGWRADRGEPREVRREPECPAGIAGAGKCQLVGQILQFRRADRDAGPVRPVHS